MASIMTEMTTYKTISQPIVAEFKDKGSRFIAFAYPILTIDDVKNTLKICAKNTTKLGIGVTPTVWAWMAINFALMMMVSHRVVQDVRFWGRLIRLN